MAAAAIYFPARKRIVDCFAALAKTTWPTWAAGMLKRWLVGIVGWSARQRYAVLAIAIAVAATSGVYVARHFAIDTNIDRLISRNLPWRQHQAEYSQAFPKQMTTILAVIDAPTPELAQSAADRLTAAFKQQRDEIRGADEGNGAPFFRRNGLLYLSDTELHETLSQLSRSGPLLGSLAADPSLRGVMASIDLSLQGVRARIVPLDNSRRNSMRSPAPSMAC